MHPPHSGDLQSHPLALRLRSLRQLHSSTSLGQAQVAALAGISLRYLRVLESTRAIPSTLRPWLALAAALHCSVEDLLAPPAPETDVVVVVLSRSHASAVVCASGNQVLEVHRQACRRHNVELACKIGRQLAIDYRARCIVADAATFASGPSGDVLQCVQLSDIARTLGLKDARPATIAAHGLRAFPTLGRFAKLDPHTGKLSRFDRRGLLVLVAGAIAAACANGTEPLHFQQMKLPFLN